ncbi:hypothetical protein L596_020087 [Steinernema carpocapsae]|uniref:BHLH domain-containing protein n=1 Tax=Steinernema carpocapsae TaxID=34508 RepID=A0A4U5MSM0_STECR|nr:hypothetical protein L596_020087 [Steinernema carpocapsae]
MDSKDCKKARESRRRKLVAEKITELRDLVEIKESKNSRGLEVFEVLEEILRVFRRKVALVKGVTEKEVMLETDLKEGKKKNNFLLSGTKPTNSQFFKKPSTVSVPLPALPLIS